MRPRILHLSRKEDGQALVELALVLPLLLLLVFAIIDFGLAFNRYNTDTNLANVAARTVAVIGSQDTAVCDGTTYSSLSTWVDCEARTLGTPVPNSVCVADTAGSTPSSTYHAADPIKVVVESNFNWLGILSSSRIVAPTTAISSSATMRLEQAPTGGTNAFLTPTCTS